MSSARSSDHRCRHRPARTDREPTTPPGPAATDAAAADPLDAEQRRLAGALMRVNHVGEICAQALYSAQALATRQPGAARDSSSRPPARRPITSPGRASA